MFVSKLKFNKPKNVFDGLCMYFFNIIKVFDQVYVCLIEGSIARIHRDDGVTQKTCTSPQWRGAGIWIIRGQPGGINL